VHKGRRWRRQQHAPIWVVHPGDDATKPFGHITITVVTSSNGPSELKAASDDPAIHGHDASTWRVTVDGWIRDCNVRRDGLLALAIVVIGVLALAWIVFGKGGATANHLITAVTSVATGLPEQASRVVGWSTAALGAGGGILALRRRRHRPVGRASQHDD
jgi:hypothetical protein